MRWLLVGFLLLAGLASAQESHDTYGKTESQILKMGMDDWMHFFTSKAGSSTADMCEGAGIYGEVAQTRNDRLLKTEKDRDLKQRVLTLRKLLAKFDSSSIDVQFAESGGGTMYNPMWASVTGEVEDLLYGFLSRNLRNTKNLVVSDVSKKLKHLSQLIEKEHQTTPNPELFKYKEAKEALAAMDGTFNGIVTIASKMDRRSSNVLLGFCLERVQNAIGEERE